MAKERQSIGWQVHAVNSQECPDFCPSYKIYKNLSKLEEDFFNSPESKQDRGNDIWIAIPIYPGDVQEPEFVE